MKLFPLVAFVCFQCVLCFGQSTNKDLVDINNKYQVILDLVDSNALRQYHTEYNHSASVEKGTLTFYYNGSELKHIQDIYTQDHIIHLDKYYIWDKEIVLLHKTYTSGSEGLEKEKLEISNHKDVIKKIEERFYFKGNTAIKCLFTSTETGRGSLKNMKNRKRSVRNIDMGCEETEELLQKYLEVLKKQELNNVKGYIFPKSISKILPDEIVHGGLGYSN